MASMEKRLSKLRDERIAREKARIEKLRELNLKKYNKSDQQAQHSGTNITKQSVTNTVKNHLFVSAAPKRPTSAPVPKKSEPSKDLTNTKTNQVNVVKHNVKPKIDVKLSIKPQPSTSKVVFNKPDLISSHHIKPMAKPNAIKSKFTTINDKDKASATVATKVLNKPDPIMLRKSMAPKISIFPKPNLTRKSLQPQKPTQSILKTNLNRESVFERLYKPKQNEKKTLNEIEKIHTDMKHVTKLGKGSGVIVNKRHTVFESKPKIAVPVRRSISAVHFKRINKNEISNCIHKWASIGDKLDKVNLKDINEDEAVKGEKIVSAIKSERKKVKFQTPVPYNLNTPKPEELQSKLKSWLQKRGKSLESYHHLQCFGIHHLASEKMKYIQPSKLELYDDENKENVALESDSDDGSYVENINEEVEKTIEPVENVKGDLCDDDKYYISTDTWRHASYVSDSADLNDTHDTTLTSGEAMIVHHVDELLTGALIDLTGLLREHSVVEANLDQLLDKFMQLKISPNSTKRKTVDPKMVDVKNVFKSTIIRFAVQQAKLRKSSQHDPPKYTVTPVRRSGRLSAHWSAKRTPLRDCATLKQAGTIAQPLHFVPNELLANTP